MQVTLLDPTHGTSLDLCSVPRSAAHLRRQPIQSEGISNQPTDPAISSIRTQSEGPQSNRIVGPRRKISAADQTLKRNSTWLRYRITSRCSGPETTSGLPLCSRIIASSSLPTVRQTPTSRVLVRFTWVDSSSAEFTDANVFSTMSRVTSSPLCVHCHRRTVLQRFCGSLRKHTVCSVRPISCPKHYFMGRSPESVLIRQDRGRGAYCANNLTQFAVL